MAAFSNISLEVFVPNPVSLTHSSLKIFGRNSDRGNSNVRISGQSLLKRNCHNSRISNDIDMKLEPVTTLDKRNTIMSKKI